MDNKNVIYKVTSPSGRVYIGQTVNLKRRLKEYRTLKCNQQTKLYNSLKKYGFDKHNIEILEYCKEEELNDRERYYQDLFDVTGVNGLNCRLTASDDRSGKLSKETIDKLKNKDVSYMIGNNFRKGIPHTDEIKKQIRNTLIEKAKKPEYINGMTGRVGEKNPFFGKKHSKETIEKILKNRKWYKPSKETIEKISIANSGENNPFFGKKHTKESLSKISDTHKGKVISKEQRLKISIANKGKVRSELNKERYRLSCANKKRVIDNSTGLIYISAAEVSRQFNINYSTLAGKLNGSKNNNTNFRYL